MSAEEKNVNATTRQDGRNEGRLRSTVRLKEKKEEMCRGETSNRGYTGTCRAQLLRRGKSGPCKGKDRR